MSAALTSVDWACAHPEGIALRHWADGTVVFDETTPQLQLLNPIAGNLMELLLKRRSATPYQLAGYLLGEDVSDEDVAMVENVLEQFSSLNLVHRLTS